MSTKPITISVDEDLHLYVLAEVERGKARSVSAYINDALTRRVEADRQADAAWRAAVEKARQDAESVERAQRRTRKARQIFNAR
ncbi:hypothetical protein ACFHYQ_08440 [Sphaerimonospora cavernae]|uniref:Uncharacterized protein n=1 Tax=Sphaerimonospora cavernae TaxID=1740611 RepID=A0ABV6U1N5_9ACTN